MVKKQKEKKKIIVSLGKRKNAVAKAKIVEGSGKIRINSKPFSLWGNDFLRMRIKEPLMLSGDLVNKVDIDVNVRGGGTTGQVESVRMAIAQGLLKFSKDKKLKQRFLSYDRNLLVFDPRRNEPHKPSRSKAGPRRHKQRSKR